MELIDGNQAATALIAELKAEVATFTGRKPCLALVRVGEDPASVSYVKKKGKDRGGNWRHQPDHSSSRHHHAGRTLHTDRQP